MYFNEHLKYNYDSNDNIAGWSVSSNEIKLHTVTVQFIIWKIWKLFHVFINLDLDMVSPFFFYLFLKQGQNSVSKRLHNKSTCKYSCECKIWTWLSTNKVIWNYQIFQTFSKDCTYNYFKRVLDDELCNGKSKPQISSTHQSCCKGHWVWVFHITWHTWSILYCSTG